jgi:hypothetical protein
MSVMPLRFMIGFWRWMVVQQASGTLGFFSQLLPDLSKSMRTATILTP